MNHNQPSPSITTYQRGGVESLLESLKREPILASGQVSWKDDPWLRRKQWHFLSINTPQLFFAFAPVNLSYMSTFFFYIYDKERRTFFEIGERGIGGHKASFQGFSTQGETAWHGKSLKLAIKNHSDHWQINFNIVARNHKLAADLRIYHVDSAAILAQDDPLLAFTHKEAGCPVEGQMIMDERSFKFEPETSFASSDWTRARLHWQTRWNFLSLAGLSQSNQQVGINLSRYIYDDTDGISAENTIWLNKIAYRMGACEFKKPTTQLDQDPWIFTAQSFNPDDAIKLELTLQPIGARREHLSLGLLASRFTQVYGMTHGIIEVQGQRNELKDIFAIAEDHWCRW